MSPYPLNQIKEKGKKYHFWSNKQSAGIFIYVCLIFSELSSASSVQFNVHTFLQNPHLNNLVNELSYISQLQSMNSIGKMDGTRIRTRDAIAQY